MSEPETHGQRDGNILVVDDNAANLAAIEAALHDLAVHVVRAASGDVALRLLLSSDFALILLDVKMPTMDGFETARLIRARKRSRHTPIIFITAHGRSDQDVQAAYELGAVDFLFKPVVPEMLRAKASVFVELHDRAREVTRQANLIRDHERREHERLLEAQRRQWEAESLRRQMEHLAEVDRRKDQFLAVLGHELRNPLAPIVAGVALLQRKFSQMQGIDESVLRARDAMQRQTEHLVRLVDDLLDVSRINSGKIELKKGLVSVQDVVHQAILTSRPGIDAQGHSLEVEIPDAPVFLLGDDVRLVQIVSNLLNNAARYTPRNGQIRIRAAVSDQSVEIIVKDNGRGISPNLLPHVFEPFVQHHDSASGGLGMGLSIVGRLTALHGGSVSAASTGIDQGSQFTVRLPVHTGPSSEGDTEGISRCAIEKDDATEPAPALVVAVVEDNPDVREMMFELLTGWGHRVVVAKDGVSGSELILKQRPHVALVDIGLPELDGYGVAARVRDLLDKETIRLVAVTGFGQDADRQRAFDAGFDAHLVKPASADAIKKILSVPGKTTT